MLVYIFNGRIYSNSLEISDFIRSHGKKPMSEHSPILTIYLVLIYIISIHI